MGRDWLSCKIGLVRPIAEDWGAFYASAPVLRCFQRTAPPGTRPKR
jgi:hypothetical protein